ncbi:MAG: hypothetical protein IKF17_04925 [Clostridia bacterium]|nr:hypothetical protein [Clostridia bacterium]
MKKKNKEDEITKEQVKLNSEKIKERDRRIKSVKLTLLIITLFLIIIYFILRIVYEAGDFTVSLDPNFARKSGLIMYEHIDEKEDKRILKATKVEFMDNISYKWLPENIDSDQEGAHNGDNYLAYTFYLENKGSDVVNYWYEIDIDDVIKNVDKAIRVRIYLNGEQTTYARPNETTGEAEEGTEKFYSASEVLVECRQKFQPGDIDKFTIVIYLEGDDPDCLDDLIGGEIKMHMDIVEEHIKQDGTKEEVNEEQSQEENSEEPETQQDNIEENEGE